MVIVFRPSGINVGVSQRSVIIVQDYELIGRRFRSGEEDKEEKEKERVYMCVCVCERERERESEEREVFKTTRRKSI